jgi:hypothetical protein
MTAHPRYRYGDSIHLGVATHLLSVPPSERIRLYHSFMATWFADPALRGTAFIKRDPQMRSHHEKWRNHAGNHLLRSLRNLGK